MDDFKLQIGGRGCAFTAMQRTAVGCGRAMLSALSQANESRSWRARRAGGLY